MPNEQLVAGHLDLSVEYPDPLHRRPTERLPSVFTVCECQYMEQPEQLQDEAPQPSYVPPTPPEPPLTVAVVVGGPGTAARLQSFQAAIGLAQVRPTEEPEAVGCLTLPHLPPPDVVSDSGVL
jgi:hypothetical protein